MGSALYITTDRDGDRFALMMDGKALSEAVGVLDRLAAGLGVTPLMDFYSLSVEEMEGVMEGEDFALPDEQWFAPEDGLPTVDALLAHLAAEEDAVAEVEAVRSDLNTLREALVTALREGLRWHLGVDV